MSHRLGRRRVAKGLLATGLALFGSPALPSRGDELAQLTIEIPSRPQRNRPFPVIIHIPADVSDDGDLRWVEVFLGDRLVGRWEFTRGVVQTEIKVILTADRAEVLRVRDYYGRSVSQRLTVEAGH